MNSKKLTVTQSVIVIIITIIIITAGFTFYFTSSPLVKLTSQLPAEITITSNKNRTTRNVILNTERQVYRLNIGESFLPFSSIQNWNSKIYYLFMEIDNIKEKCTLSKLSFIPSDLENRLTSLISLDNNNRTLNYKIHSSVHSNEYLIIEDSNVKSSFSRASSNRTYLCNTQDGNIEQLLQEFMTEFILDHNNQ